MAINLIHPFIAGLPFVATQLICRACYRRWVAPIAMDGWREFAMVTSCELRYTFERRLERRKFGSITEGGVDNNSKCGPRSGAGGLILLATLILAYGCKPAPEPMSTARSDAASQDGPPQISPEYVGDDGVVDLQGRDRRRLDVIDDTPGIPADAVFGTPTLAEPVAGSLVEGPTLALPEPQITSEATVSAISEVAPEVAAQQPTAAAETETNPAAAQTVPKQSSGIGNLATDEELNQQIAKDWPKPDVVFVLTGQQHGYLEPCGCTGLERQKGGLIRRDTLVQELQQRGWSVVPLDVGNQVRRVGRQPELQFQATLKAFSSMGYKAVTLGADDLKLNSLSLLQLASSDDPNKPREYISANAFVYGPELWPKTQIVEIGSRKIGITGYLSEAWAKNLPPNDVLVEKPEAALKAIVADLKSKGCNYLVLLAHASQEDSEAIAVTVPGFDLVVTAGGQGEPRNVLDPIKGSTAKISQVGTKGMYTCIVGLFDDADNPVRYQRIALSSQFKDSARMLDVFEEYQNQLREIGFESLGLKPQDHPSGRRFVGSDECSGCHSTAYEVWKNSPHFHATQSIVTPPNDRGSIPRHFDPECVSCHVTGWNAQRFTPYTGGYWSLNDTPKLVGSGCENCHGPGSEHVQAENGDIEADNDLLVKLREQMRLTMANARDKCIECHDLDNSPDFYAGGDQFHDYWERARPGYGPVKHVGKD